MFYTSGRTSNEAAFVYQLFVREFGTNNLPDCSNMCHESSGSALSKTIGIGKGSVLLEDLYKAELIIIAGQNPGTNHPRMLTALEKAKENGARIVAVNPLPEAGLKRFKNPQRRKGIVGHGTELADLFLQVKVNGDLALFQALNLLLLEAEDRAPGTRSRPRPSSPRTPSGFDEFAAATRKLDWDDVSDATGLSREQIEELAALVMRSRSIVVCWAMGLTQHKNSVPTIREIVNFLLLRGNIGRPGAGVCPVRGHSNVQGDRTMGIWEKPKPEFLDALKHEFGIEPPRAHGFDTVEAIRAMRDGKAKVFVAMGGNFAAATPDTQTTLAALESVRLNVQVSTKLNRSHTVVGDIALILPTLGRTEHDVQAGGEQFVSVEDSMGIVHSSSGVLAPASRYLLSEVAIVCRLARAVLGDASPVPWAEFEDRLRPHQGSIARVVPGFDDFNARVRVPGGFALPHPPRDSRTFPTESGLAEFTVNELVVVRPGPGRLILQTIRSHDQYNTTIYGLNDRYRGIHHGRRVVFVNPADIETLGLADGDIVDLVSLWTDGASVAHPHSGSSHIRRRGLRGCLFPRNQRPGAARQHG